jgi:hypothetical protein
MLKFEMETYEVGLLTLVETKDSPSEGRTEVAFDWHCTVTQEVVSRLFIHNTVGTLCDYHEAPDGKGLVVRFSRKVLGKLLDPVKFLLATQRKLWKELQRMKAIASYLLEQDLDLDLEPLSAPCSWSPDFSDN